MDSGGEERIYIDLDIRHTWILKLRRHRWLDPQRHKPHQHGPFIQSTDKASHPLIGCHIFALQFIELVVDERETE